VELVSMGAPAGQIVCLGEGMLELTGADDSFASATAATR
jgi:hypothetical protein